MEDAIGELRDILLRFASKELYLVFCSTKQGFQILDVCGESSETLPIISDRTIQKTLHQVVLMCRCSAWCQVKSYPESDHIIFWFIYRSGVEIHLVLSV